MWTFDSDTDPGYWVEVDSPTNVTLRDLTDTVNGPVAVGDKGVAIGRGNDRWGVILENGPGARSRALHAVDTTDDGERVYFAGAGGAFGYYDLRTEQRRDYSQPRGNANTFYALAVAGDRGEEKFLVGDGSGNVVPGSIRDGDEVTFDWETAPNSGNAVEALCHDADGYGYAVDVNSNVFMTTATEGWTRVGVDDAQGSFYDCAFGDGVFVVVGGNGMVFEAAELIDHDDEATWTPTELGGFTVYGLDAGYGGQLACGEGGSVFVRRTGGEWEQGKHDSSPTFLSGLVGEQMVVVGAGGLIVERRAPDEVDEETKARHGDGTDEGDDGPSRESSEWVTNADEAVESDIDWRVRPTADRDSADGDNFDGRGENYDGDGVAPGEDGDSGNDAADPADEPDGDGNDQSDPPDEPDGGGGSGNDEADPPDENTDSDADSPD